MYKDLINKSIENKVDNQEIKCIATRIIKRGKGQQLGAKTVEKNYSLGY